MKLDERLEVFRSKLGEAGYLAFWLVAGAATGAVINWIMRRM